MYAKDMHPVPGVRVPAWLRLIDCRGEPLTVRTPDGRVLYGAERAIWHLGLSEENACTTTSAQLYWDLRDAPETYLAEQLREAVRAAKGAREVWRKVSAAPAQPGEGGTVHYDVACVAVCNFGWSLVADKRTGVVRGFG